MLKKLKIAVAYLICLFMPKAYVDVINEAASVSELDEKLTESIGFKL